MKRIHLAICALAGLLLLTGCAGGAPPTPRCVADWQTICSGPETNGGAGGR